ncbi:hypothetical protein JIQ42_05617 [Leishmania sp. Namibia]|uniref:hypothetical protein n=1 Tax=Leishmania sp. Namibia TaxID=2802991 RepID=UPI001B598AAA|nr:hypothetical protein JIQ42_05617 [Leishmania sp. Namibia]
MAEVISGLSPPKKPNVRRSDSADPFATMFLEVLSVDSTPKAAHAIASNGFHPVWCGAGQTQGGPGRRTGGPGRLSCSTSTTTTGTAHVNCLLRPSSPAAYTSLKILQSPLEQPRGVKHSRLLSRQLNALHGYAETVLTNALVHR